jgi:hypothetical protein
MELAKVNEDNDELHGEYSKIMIERDEFVQKTTNLQ